MVLGREWCAGLRACCHLKQHQVIKDCQPRKRNRTRLTARARERSRAPTRLFVN